jgi:CDP-glycerol glycerophosphotransferase (TagB/SpsB family)
VIPHCYDQASLIERVAEALPHGYDIVLKEHPMSVGRNRLQLLRRLAGIPNARIVDPHTNSHDLIQQAEAIVVISSTVGLEALLYERPVMTLGQPYYSGYGVTLDVDSFREIREAVPALLSFRPDGERIARFLHAAMRACRPGRPMLVDAPDLSDENVRALADSIDGAVGSLAQPDALVRA